jgi:hypothetical protein
MEATQPDSATPTPACATERVRVGNRPVVHDSVYLSGAESTVARAPAVASPDRSRS